MVEKMSWFCTEGSFFQQQLLYDRPPFFLHVFLFVCCATAVLFFFLSLWVLVYVQKCRAPRMPGRQHCPAGGFDEAPVRAGDVLAFFRELLSESET